MKSLKNSVKVMYILYISKKKEVFSQELTHLILLVYN
jgi:hypothetical protein